MYLLSFHYPDRWPILVTMYVCMHVCHKSIWFTVIITRTAWEWNNAGIQMSSRRVSALVGDWLFSTWLPLSQRWKVASFSLMYRYIHGRFLMSYISWFHWSRHSSQLGHAIPHFIFRLSAIHIEIFRKIFR